MVGQTGTPFISAFAVPVLIGFLAFACLPSTSQAGPPTPTASQPDLDQRDAKKVFGGIAAAVPGAPEAFGKYDRGCIAGAKKLSTNGPGWQVMRPSRNRMWGHPMLLAYLRRLAQEVRTQDHLSGILVGDMSQPLGGPLLGGHASHQIGLDADLWYRLMPPTTLSAPERETLAAESVVDLKTLTVNGALWGEEQIKLLHRAASHSDVARIFVHPAVKRALCESVREGADKAWLSKVRPWWQHNDHFHIRLSCPAGNAACIPQPPLAGDDGCGTELDEWFKKLRAPPPPKSAKPSPLPKPVLMADMPEGCRALIRRVDALAHP